HACSNPAVAASPEEWNVRSMIEEAIRLLEFVEIDRHLMCGMIQILAISGCAIRLRLHGSDHVHVVDPETRLAGCAIGIRISPLLVCERLSELQIFWFFGLNVEFKRH